MSSSTIMRAALLALTAIGLTSAAPSQTTITRQTSAIPDYVLTYAPYTYLYSQEEYWQGDVATHLEYMIPEINYVPLADGVNMQNVSSYNSSTYLTSKDNVLDNPAWLLGTANQPNSTGYSEAPATIIVVDKGNGTVDAFYFYFYSYNSGPVFLPLNHRFGNHVGDWEHTMVRFNNSEPAYIYLSAHDSGYAYTYSALPSSSGRAITYVANGTHANYATAGEHDYADIGDLLADYTDAGPYWDVTQNFRGFWWSEADGFTLADGVSTGGSEELSEGASWLEFGGAWGDEQYPTSDPRQECIVDECYFVSGPTGPIDKNLGRTAVCEDESDCTIATSV